MADQHVEYPQRPGGEEQEQIQQIYSYLYQLAETLNNNFISTSEELLRYVNIQTAAYSELAEDGGVQSESVQTTLADAAARAETLKSMIIKNSQDIEKEIKTLQVTLKSKYVAQSEFGTYFEDATNNVELTPFGQTQHFTLQQLIQGAGDALGKSYSTEYKGYIKSGYLRDENGIPIYGVAIGKDLVTFDANGQPVYTDGNKVASLSDEELSFWQNGVKIASYTASEIDLMQNGANVAKFTASGVTFLNTTATLADLTGSELAFYQGGNKVASMTAGGITFYQNGNPVGTYTSSGVTLYAGNVSVASFGSTVRIGSSAGNNVYIDSSCVHLRSGSTDQALVDSNGLKVYKSGTQVAHFGTDATIGSTAGSAYNTYIDSDGAIYFRAGTTNYAKITTSGLYVYNSSGTELAHFGTDATIGSTSGSNNNIYVDNSGVHIRYGTTDEVLVNTSGLKIYRSGTEVASYGSTTTIGNTSGRHVEIQNGAVYIKNGSTVEATFDGNTRLGSTTGQNLYMPSGGGYEFYNGTTAQMTYNNSSQEMIFYGPNGRYLKLNSSGITYYAPNITIVDWTGTTVQADLAYHFGDSWLDFSVNGSQVFSVDPAGNIMGINTLSIKDISCSNKVEGYYLHSTGSIRADGNITGANITASGTVTAASYVTTSDGRKKELLQEEIPDIDGIRAVRFRWKEGLPRAGGKSVGYIAQEVEKVLPELVVEGEDGMKNLDYNAFLCAKIERMEQRIEQLEARLAQLEQA